MFSDSYLYLKNNENPDLHFKLAPLLSLTFSIFFAWYYNYFTKSENPAFMATVINSPLLLPGLSESSADVWYMRRLSNLL